MPPTRSSQLPLTLQTQFRNKAAPRQRPAADRPGHNVSRARRVGARRAWRHPPPGLLRRAWRTPARTWALRKQTRRGSPVGARGTRGAAGRPGGSPPGDSQRGRGAGADTAQRSRRAGLPHGLPRRGYIRRRMIRPPCDRPARPPSGAPSTSARDEVGRRKRLLRKVPGACVTAPAGAARRRGSATRGRGPRLLPAATRGPQPSPPRPGRSEGAAGQRGGRAG